MSRQPVLLFAAAGGHRVRVVLYGVAMLSALKVRRAVWLLVGAMAAGLIAAPDGSARPKATASRACAHTHVSVWTASTAELRSAVVCLIDRFRNRRGLPGLAEQDQLNGAAQGHSDAMVY